ncbi:hypothetical protein BABINDRAFT_54304 [Babjeviella inositovora NRRL Y-12698]|uniref:Protein phosphatase methylesterase 1 n=1 Tax=Babjeviella inositovora NRRL Y-12698 TaxID=984486 RepID=A0A1E3QIJ6_9ASCO|nr:uncharacterized protein BABINDRAFT_54304 [Babjeviella inositovora NRRL Y-12698]ODQ77428.1 hypothetical protein BABINDRAFT_54304 [Babjeviella inositovora NRRL Y-12698]
MSEFQRKLFKVETPGRGAESLASSTPDVAKEAYFQVNEVYEDPQTRIRFQTFYTPPSGNGPLYVFHHGAGSSAMSFALLARELRERWRDDSTPIECGVFAFDMRGHGLTHGGESLDYSLARLVADFSFVTKELFRRHFNDTAHPSTFLVGHSLGGAILTNAVSANRLAPLKVTGLVMLDIVEETAIRSLSVMPLYLKTRPKQFASLDMAIKWHLRTNLLHNFRSAQISVPAILSRDASEGYCWRTRLEDTEPYWSSWFQGLSSRFVAQTPSLAKLLILAGQDKLDKELMIGQMQGKYQLVVFQDSGHFIQEDCVSKTAITLVEFSKRNDLLGFMDQKGPVIKALWGKVNSI